MKVAMIGLRGVPHAYGGVEVAVEEIGARLAAAGHDVTVYCMANRMKKKETKHRGMRLVYIPTIRLKNLEMIIYCFLATLHALSRGMDIVHFHAVGPASMAVLSWLRRVPSVVTVHGLDWMRDKWSAPARLYLRLSAWAMAKCAGELICVSQTLQTYFEENYGRPSDCIPNGVAPATFLPLDEIGAAFALEPRCYVLFVGRLVPEKKVDQLILAFRDVATDFKLVIVGGSEDNADRRLQELCTGDCRVVMTGPMHGPALSRLFTNAAIFVLPSTVEGLSLALLEALSYRLPVLVSDIPANVEAITEGGERLAETFRAGDTSDLAHRLNHIIDHLAAKREQAGRSAERLLRRYDWDIITKATLDVYQRAKCRP